ncbi:MAG: ATP-binding cassette domain-containing protein [Streptococcaceae bacterium]|jgi:ABC-2 type transport system ATP-binding protein|nr:ATP-binding cassette domain-containing protein [Streptococcaceae bacterium]
MKTGESEMNNIIQIQNLTKAFDGKEVVANCNMNVQKNSIYGFLGANGAGKTTVLKLITGLLNPTAGKISVMNLDSQESNSEVLRNIGCMIETPLFYEHLSATENLELHLSYMDIQNTNVGEVLNLVGLSSTGNQSVSQFSLGMRQRLGIARAIIHKPKILLLDEPINGLDPMGIKEMRELFLTLVKKENMTIVVSSHILSEIEYVADKIGVIVDGAIVEEVTLSSIREKYPEGLEEYFLSKMSGGKNNE